MLLIAQHGFGIKGRSVLRQAPLFRYSCALNSIMEVRMAQEIIHSDDAPAALGPYVQARRIGSWLITSGQVALDPKTGEMVGTTAAEQAKQVLTNLAAVLKAGGATPSDVIKTTVFLTDMADFAAVNEVYAAFFGQHKPARSCVAVAQLPKNALVEIECMAAK